MQQVEEMQVDQPAAKRRKTQQGGAEVEAARQQAEEKAEGPAWPIDCMVLHAHALQLSAASNLFCQQLNGDTTACAGHKCLRVYTANGREQHVLIVTMHPDQPSSLGLAGECPIGLPCLHHCKSTIA